MFQGPFAASIIKRAKEKHLIDIQYINIRDFATDRYHSVDDHPYGGGTGMILRVDVVDRAIQRAKSKAATRERVILLDPQGIPFTQHQARKLSTFDHVILLCGHYEGIDERIRSLVDEEISIGDYVLTGGEIPAMVIVDSITRLIPGVLPKAEATLYESFENDILECPQYTRPEIYKNERVPTVLTSGNHAKITAWQKNEACVRTKKRRPDLLK